MDIIQHSPIWHRFIDGLCVGKEQKMKCEDCCHAEMCKWIDELEGRGCDFLSQEPCELLIIKSDILLHQEDRKKWIESIKREKENGVIILPPYFEPLLVPANIEINIEQEPCDDAISREAVLSKIQRYNETEGGFSLINSIKELPPVTQKSGKCKNCKYFEYDSVAKVDGIPLIVAHEICNKWGDGCKTSEDGYCYLFEPQESEGSK